MIVELRIGGDLASGAVQITGPIDDLRVMYWLLGEARRIAEHRADQRDAAATNGKPQLVLARDLDPMLRRQP